MRIPEQQAEIDALVREFLTDAEPEPNGNGHHYHAPSSRSDEEIIEKLRAQRNGKFDRLWHGDLSDYGGDHSSADDGFVHKVWSYTQDEEQVRRIHDMSGLSRDKSARRADYLRRSIVRAQKRVDWFYEWPKERIRVGEKKGKEAKEEQPKPPNPFQRSDLAGALERGVEPPEVLIPEVLLAAKVHSVYSAGGTGKTYFAVYVSRKVLEKGKTVLYFDQENGLRIMAERAQGLGITPKLAKNFHHYPFPTMPLDFAVIKAFEDLLDELEPDLVIFDSWVNMLAMCGLDENSSVDIATWTEAYSQKARHRGIAVLILDHVPKEGGSARGSGRKLDYVDVMWELRNPQAFDRETVGRIDLHLRKDREGWLPRVLTYSVGGTENGLVFKRSLGTVEPKDEAGLTSKERTTLEALEALGSMGAFDREWKEEAATRDVKKSKYYEARKRLLDLGLVEKVMDKFFVNDLQKQGPDKSSGVHMDYAGEGVQSSPGGLDPGLTGPPVDEEVEERCQHGTPEGYPCDECEMDGLFGGGSDGPHTHQVRFVWGPHPRPRTRPHPPQPRERRAPALLPYEVRGGGLYGGDERSEPLPAHRASRRGGGELMPRTTTRPADDPKMWRRLVSRAHPDAGGDHELFIWATATREVVCGGELGSEIPRREYPDRPPGGEHKTPERVSFDPFANFGFLTDRALSMAEAVAEPYGYLLRQLADCHPATEGTLCDQQRRGATYKQLASIGHQVGMSGAERAQWYDVCRSIPLSQRHAGHILSRLKRQAA